MKSVAYITGFAIAVLFALLVFIIVMEVKHKRGVKDEYDERQELVRGKAYKYALFTLMIYLCADLVVGTIWRAWAQPGVSSALGIFLSAGVFVAVCILNDAFLSLRQKPKQSIGMVLLVIACQMPSIILNRDALIENGMLTYKVLPLGCAALFACELIMLLIHLRCEGNGDDA